MDHLGGIGECVLSDPIEDGMVWASVDSCLYLSTDFGSTWQQMILPQCIIYDIKSGQSITQKVIFLATTEGVLRSLDNGLNWQSVHAGVWKRIALKTSDLSSIYAANSGEVIKSTDLGLTWYTILNRPFIGDIAVWEGNPQHIFVGSGNGIEVSYDGGGFWQNIGPAGKQVNALNIYQNNENIILAGCTYKESPTSPPEYAIYKTNDGGTTWNQVLYWGFNGQQIKCIENSPLQPRNVIVGGLAGLPTASCYRSTDYGETWIETPSMGVNKDYFDFSYSGFNLGMVFCASTGIWKSNDNGETWVFTTKGMKPRIPVKGLELGITEERIFAIPFFGLRGKYHIDGLLHTTNSGDDWQYWNGLPWGFKTEFIKRVPHGIYYLSGDGYYNFYKSTDDGFNWIPKDPLPPSVSHNIPCFDTRENNVIYAVLAVPGQDRVAKSLDGAETWEIYTPPTQPPFPYLNFTAVKVSPISPTRVYLGESHSYIFYISTDGGVSWQLSNQGLPVNNNINPITAIATTDDKLLLLGINGPSVRGVYRSEDGGAHWSYSNLDANVNWLSPDPVDPSIFYAATNQGFFVSADFGKGWADLSEGLIEPMIYFMRPFGTKSVLYAGTDYGIYRYEPYYAITGDFLATAYQATKLNKMANGCWYAYASPGGIFVSFVNELGGLQTRKRLGSGNFPCTVLDANNNPCAIWQRNVEIAPLQKGGELWFSRFDGTNWSEPYRLASFTGPYSLDVNLPSFTIDPRTNTGYVVFEYRDRFLNGPNSHLLLGWFDILNPGSFQYTQLEFAPHPERCEFPSISLGGNYLYIAFQREHKIFRIKWDIINHQIVERTQVSEDGRFSHHPYVDVQANGVINYVWEDSSADNIEIYGKYEVPPNQWYSRENVSNTSGKSQWPQICKGTTWITWSEFIWPPVDNNWDICYKDMEYEGYQNLSQTLEMSKYSHGVVTRSPYWPPPYEPKLTAIWTEGNQSPYEIRVKTVIIPSPAYFYVDAGREEASPWTVQRDGDIQFAPEPEKTIDYHSQKLIYHFPNLNPEKRYRIKLVFYFESQSQNRWKMKIDADNIFHANIWITPGTVTTLERWLPTACYKDGEIYLNITKIVGDYAFIAQIFIYEYEREEIEEITKNTQESGSLPANEPGIFIRPNPVHSVASISYSLPANTQGRANLKIYDASGRMVRRWDYETIRLSDNISWSGTDETGKALSNGIYFVVLETGKDRLTQKLTLIR
jgi:photosystem II stability/assembly factor-like uncharacterized protein